MHDITCDSEIGPSLGIKGHRFVHKKVSLSQESQSSHHEGTYFIDRLCAHSRRKKCKMICSAKFAKNFQTLSKLIDFFLRIRRCQFHDLVSLS